MPQPPPTTATQPPTKTSVLIVGAGFGGIYQLHTLLHPPKPPLTHSPPNQQQQQHYQPPLSAIVIDTAPAPGGTWHHNRYPGALSDTESYIYRYSWDSEDLRTYPWHRHYLRGPEVLAYLEHVVRRHGLGGYMQLGTRLVRAVWDGNGEGGEGVWRATVARRRDPATAVDDGQVEAGEVEEIIEARYIITALGLLSKKHYPSIPGIIGPNRTFKGQIAHTASWPDGIDLTNKRVGIIGNGSTGVQVITAIAPIVGHLTCFQRRAQYSVPSGDGPVSASYRAQVNENYDEIMAQLQTSNVAFGFEESTTPYASVTSAAEREAIFESLWQKGNGFRFMFGGFCDIATNREANEGACAFIRKKIGEIVRDPVTARKLMPTDMYARRPLCDGGYYKQFNRSNVSLVDISAERGTPITHFTETGAVTSDGVLHEVDVLILATGFDAVEGSYSEIDIRGVGGRTLAEHWAEDGPTSYLGLMVAGFPNFFLITGPQGPFCNVPPIIETQVRFVRFLIGMAEASRRALKKGNGGGGSLIEATAESEKEWVRMCNELSQGSLFRETSSWIFGHNIEGKKVAARFYFGGLGGYNKILKEVVERGLRGFKPLANADGPGNRESQGKL
ncbi:hypothetical protein FQN50_005197 [Emmonsiellopsis sp. PD_5]|nr:hypothetical protein FQN50_005197 [Emmonsiellopsis sp. PD_5]